MDLSICIPTRNRAAHLERCLTHLSGFRGFSVEIIIGDNASEDDTPAVVERFLPVFAHLIYLRHESDIGFARNADSICRRARADYLYVLSDDDILFENAAAAMIDVLKSHPTAVAVAGKYLGALQTSVGMNPALGAVKISVVPRGQVRFLAHDILHLCDGHPMMRREVFQRHCRYQDGSLGLMPLFTRLVRHGDILFMDCPLLQHLANSDSLSTKLPEPWFQDLWASEVELAFANASETPLPSVVEAARLGVLRTTYFQAARLSRARGQVLTMWHYLQRAKAIGAGENLLLRCERDFLIAVVLTRILQIADDIGCSGIALHATPLMEVVARRLRELAPAFVIEDVSLTPPPDGRLRMIESYDVSVVAKETEGPVLAFYDVVDMMRLTPRDACIALSGEKGAEVPSVEFTDAGVLAMLARPYPAYDHFLWDYS